MQLKYNSEEAVICLIAAFSFNSRTIGKNSKLPWNIPEDLEHFKQLTTGNALIFGRKTYEGISRPLPSRLNIVLSKKNQFSAENLITAKHFQEAVQKAVERGYRKIFICGGQEIYTKYLEKAQYLYLTEIKQDYDGDAFFPEFDEKNYLEIEREEKSEFTFRTLKRI